MFYIDEIHLRVHQSDNVETTKKYAVWYKSVLISFYSASDLRRFIFNKFVNLGYGLVITYHISQRKVIIHLCTTLTAVNLESFIVKTRVNKYIEQFYMAYSTFDEIKVQFWA